MEHIELFAGGIAAFSIAAEWMEWKTIGLVEIDKFCRSRLRRNFPDAIVHGDIFDVTARTFPKFRGTGIITASCECQGVSAANPTGKGLNENQWRKTMQICDWYEPDWFVFENVPNYKRLDIDRLCADLESKGYETQTLDFPASSVGLPTLERHVWIVASRPSQRPKSCTPQSLQRKLHISKEFQRGNTGVRFGRRVSESRFREVGERTSRSSKGGGQAIVKMLGNSFPPQMAYQIFRIINAVECEFN